jgi:N-acetylglucosamine-6-phosphate deacetylase
LPGLIDGEKRNVSKYDEALKPSGVPANLVTLLTRQRESLVKKIAELQAMTAKSERVP